MQDSKPPHHTIEERLRDLGLRVTPARIEIYRCLASQHRLLTIDEISNHLRATMPSAPDWATVYRTIVTFEEEGIVSSSDFGDGVTRYEIRHEHEHHHHVICRICRSIEPLDHCTLKKIETDLTEAGYSELSHRLEFFGICADCKGTAKK